MPKTALILFAHGARDPEWAAPLRRVTAAAHAQAPALRIALAFLEMQGPTLADAAQTLVDEGFARIVIVPMFMAQGGHLKNDVPHLVAALRAANPTVSFDLVPAIGEAASVIQAMAGHVLSLAGDKASDH